MLANIEERSKVLKEEVLHYRSFAAYAGKIGVFIEKFFASHYLAVDEVGSRLIKDLKVACLLDVEIHGHERPHCVVHPDSCDPVSVSNELAALASDDGGVCAVAPHAAEVIDEHASYVRRIHDDERQTVLPEVSPASAALAVVVVGEERAAVNTAKHRLDAYPVHPVVEGLVTGMEPDVIPVDPVVHVFRELGIENFRIQVFNSHCLKGIRYCEDLFLCIGGLIYVVYCEREKVILRFSGRQSLIEEHGCAHGFKTVNSVTEMVCISMGHRESRVIKCSALADVIFSNRAEDSRLFAVSFGCKETVDDFISSVSALVERECRVVGYAVIRYRHAVEHGRNVPVVSDVIC